MGRSIIWYNTADKSWGGCEYDDFLIIEVDDLTDAELDDLSEVDNEDDVYDILMGAVERINAE